MYYSNNEKLIAIAAGGGGVGGGHQLYIPKTTNVNLSDYYDDGQYRVIRPFIGDYGPYGPGVGYGYYLEGDTNNGKNGKSWKEALKNKRVGGDGGNSNWGDRSGSGGGGGAGYIGGRGSGVAQVAANTSTQATGFAAGSGSSAWLNNEVDKYKATLIDLSYGIVDYDGWNGPANHFTLITYPGEGYPSKQPPLDWGYTYSFINISSQGVPGSGSNTYHNGGTFLFGDPLTYGGTPIIVKSNTK